MTSRGQDPTLRPHGVPSNAFSILPTSHQDRVQKSLDSLSETDSENGVLDNDDMDSSLPRELPPDYGDEESSANLSSLSELNESSVLRVIKDRYSKDQIYTRCGDILISVNPFKKLDIFGIEDHEAYSQDTPPDDVEPHVFWLANQAVRRRQRDHCNQVVLVSGESGAGKTEAVKLMLQHILFLSQSAQGRLRENLEQVNPLIELFGNARTRLNKNSSRFAKYLDVKFLPDNTVAGASVHDYILEKSRVVSPSDRDSNFHIFYTFIEDVMEHPEKQEQFMMEGMDKYDFRIVPKKSWVQCDSRMSPSDQARVFRQLGITNEEVDNVHAVLAAILHLTNVYFVPTDDMTDGVEVDNEDAMNRASALLCVDPKTLAVVLVTETTVFAGEEIQRCRSFAKAQEARDAIAKALYERLFGWLIRRINTALNRTPTQEAAIGFLDICGFEDLSNNSLEQLCINLANENLQRFMNTQVFLHEQRIYRDQGIDLGQVNPPSNAVILQMFEAPKTGLLALVDEDTHLEMATDRSLVKKLVDSHRSANWRHFLPWKNQEPNFGIAHFAGPVWYNANNFLEKNGDALNEEVKDMLVASSNELISDIFQVAKAPTGSISPTQFQYRTSRKHTFHVRKPGLMKLSSSINMDISKSLADRFKGNTPKMQPTTRASQRTVLDCFRASMKELLQRMNEAKPLFVRCVKPNDGQQQDSFHDNKVAKQLRYNGVTEIARIRRVWFPVRLPMNTFIEQYHCLAPECKRMSNKNDAIFAILRKEKVDSDHFRIGTSQIFLKENASATLEKSRAELERREEEAEARRIKEEEERARKARSPPGDDAGRSNLKSALKPQHPLQTAATLDPIKEGGSFNESRSESDGTRPKAHFANLQSSIASQRTQKPPKPNDGNMSGSESESSSDAEHEAEKQAKQSKTSEKRFWDIFQVVAREQPTVDIQDTTAMKVLKAAVYLLLLVIVLTTATAQKVALMMMVSAIGPFNARANVAVAKAYTILMVVSICIPYILNFATSVAKVAFGGYRNPSLVTWIWVFVTESFHSVGLTLLVFRVLPRLDLVHGLLLLSATGLLPALLKPVMGAEVEVTGLSRWRPLQRGLSVLLDLLALCGQLSFFPVMFAVGYVAGSTDQVDLALELAFAPVLVSFACWENFTDGRFFVKLENTNRFKNFVLKRRYELEHGRFIPQIVTSVWKIALTVVLPYLYVGEWDLDYSAAFRVLESFQTEWKAVTTVAVFTLSAMVCYYLSYIACKLRMQRFSFVLPLTLATPCALLVFYLNTQYEFLASVTRVTTAARPKDGDFLLLLPDDVLHYWRTLVPGLAWFISMLILTRYVWFPRQPRLAKIEMLFLNPLYCGILTAESLFLNRRRHTMAVTRSRDGANNVYYRISRRERQMQGTEDDDGVYTDITDSDDRDSGGVNRNRLNPGEEDVPVIYACATMWHETRREMIALLKSVHRIDREQWLKRQAQDMTGERFSDYFEYEAHVFFDDAMTQNKKKEFIPNDYVKLLVSAMQEAVSSVYRKTMPVLDPFKIPTPYGGQLLWVMPCGNLLFVHLKDKTKIRHKKRWSQVMYMYYLLGYRLTRPFRDQIVEAVKAGRMDAGGQWQVDRDDVVGSDIFDMLDERVTKKAHNTFVMALDGDTDFSPGSVHILLDRMKKNRKVGAACGRIHPIGSGPLVWYQMFEYAIGHWMQKATEHVLGCVLCSPGCFSLFRGSALMDDNVMRKYTTLPTEASHFLQYDQGEDRWLCTLLLQQGYRVDYAAAADAWTYAPEGFFEFFNQRRRWMPSTLANVLDLLSDYQNTVAVNSNISMLYIIYQVALMVATLLGPGTVLMMIAGAIGVVFQVDLLWSYAITLVPAILYVVVCMTCKSNVQLYLAALMSTFYTFVMLVVFVGTIILAAQESIFHPSVVVIAVLIIIFVIAGLCHPKELYCLPPGALYLLCIPSGYLLLVIYSLCNLQVVSWGTRETPKVKTEEEIAKEEEEKRKKKEEKAKKKGFFGRLFPNQLNDLKEIIQSASGTKEEGNASEVQLQLLRQINDNLTVLTQRLAGDTGKEGAAGQDTAKGKTAGGDAKAEKSRQPSVKKTVKIAPDAIKAKVKSKAQKVEEKRDELVNPRWAEDPGLGKGEVMALQDPEETVFWQQLIEEYLKPLDADSKKEQDMQASLLDLRNSVVFAVSMINLLWIAINFMFQLTNPVTIVIPLTDGEEIRVGILGLLFVFFLLSVLLLQIVGMFIHRWGTLLHLLASTTFDLLAPCRPEQEQPTADTSAIDLRRAYDFCRTMVQEPEPDYLDDEESRKNAIMQSVKERLQVSTTRGLGALGESVARRMNESGLVQRNFLSSPPVQMYLSGTRAQNEDTDQRSIDFVRTFRQTVRRGGQGPEPNRSPPLPSRQQFAGVRNRFHNYDFRSTVRDIIERAEHDSPRLNIPRNRGDGAGVMAQGRYESDLDRTFSRQMHRFNEYSRNAVPQTRYNGGFGNRRRFDDNAV